MGGLNKMLVIGHLGTDPDMRYTPNGNPVTSFRLATSRRYTTSDGERREETEWFRVVCWNQLAERCNQFLTRGKKVYVEGRLKSDTWDGQRRSDPLHKRDYSQHGTVPRPGRGRRRRIRGRSRPGAR